MQRNIIIWITVCWPGVWIVLAAPAAAIPVFARIYDKPCGACHTVFPQLNPQGENFRAHGLHGLTPSIKPLKVGPSFDLPGTLPLALYMGVAEDISKADQSGQRDPTRTHFNLSHLSVLAGGELGERLAFLMDYELIESEADSGDVTINSGPYQAYLIAHAEPWGWLGNLKAGWYELPLLGSPEIHRLSIRPYLINGLRACTLLGVDPPRGRCEDLTVPGETQIGIELNATHPMLGWAWALGVTNGSNSQLRDVASKDFYLHATRMFGLHRAGLFLSYNPDIVGAGIGDRTLRLGPEIDFYRRQFRLLGQFLAEYESNPTGHQQDLWYYGAYVEADYRFTTRLLWLLRADYAWSPIFDDRSAGGETRFRRRVWELTSGWQWSILQNLKAVGEVTYGENHEAVGGQTTKTWVATLRLLTAFWPLTPPGLDDGLACEARL